jgi:hypothetical protein
MQHLISKHREEDVAHEAAAEDLLHRRTPKPFANSFGTVSLSADGTSLAVGAAFEDSAATGIGGDQTDNSATDSGAVYLY